MTVTGTAIAIVGTGAMGRAHARAFAGAGVAHRIAYLCSARNPAPLTDAPDARLTTSFEEVLADRAVGVVSICTPTDSHRDLATRALRAGKHVLLEKPIALTVADAAAILDVAEASEGYLMVAHVVRFFGGYEAIGEAVSAGAVGVPLSVSAERVSPPAPSSPWWQDESRSGGPLVDFAIHDFDQLNLFLGTPVTVRTERARPDGPILTTVEYADGGLGRVLTSMQAPSGFGFTSAIDVLGSTGLLAHRFIGGGPGDAGPLTLDALGSASAVGSLAVDGGDPYRRQAEYFLDRVERRLVPDRVTGRSAVAALAVSLAARASLASGRTERVDGPPDA